MNFASGQFAAFLCGVVVVSWALRSRVAQNSLLLAASWWFYALFDVRFLGLMWISTVVDYLLARAIFATSDERARKRLLVASVAVNLGILATFKYFDFFLTSASHLLDALGGRTDPPVLRVLLPVGISFYTFHGISYVFDVYRRQIAPASSIGTYALFVAFFPQQVAGPIGRAQVQLPQFERARTRPPADQIFSGGALILMGLFKKVAIADALAPSVVLAFGGASTNSWIALAVGAASFSLQIYGDFSGYSDMARGSARLVGIDLPVNFIRPFFASNITDFWRRWHVSLSSWLRDYLYIPLGGDRGSRWSTSRNLLLTMALGGLWHGAAWTFVAWGIGHGTLLVIERWWHQRSSVRLPRRRLHPALGALITWLGVSALFVVFRASSLHQAGTYLVRMVSLQPGGYSRAAIAILIYASASLFALDWFVCSRPGEPDLMMLAPAPRGVAVAVMVAAIAVHSGGPRVPFIYFQF